MTMYTPTDANPYKPAVAPVVIPENIPAPVDPQTGSYINAVTTEKEKAEALAAEKAKADAIAAEKARVDALASEKAAEDLNRKF